MKKSEIKPGITYFLCPKKSCKLFFDQTVNTVPCEYNCPYKKKLKKLVICEHCGEIAVLSGDHHPFQYFPHNVGNCAVLIKRYGTVSRLIYTKPK